MSHENPQKHNKYKTALGSSFWFVIILVGLFIAAVNFVNVMGHDEEEGHGGHGAATEAPQHMEATSGQTMEGETGNGKPTEHNAVQGEGTEPSADSSHTEGH